MTNLSVNLNKIALLRNARGHNYPDVIAFAKKFMDLGVRGITIHPRTDERHITAQDAVLLGDLLNDRDDVELNIEGYPSKKFLSLVEFVQPDQCTLVPDKPGQLTSDHGWNLLDKAQSKLVTHACRRLSGASIRSALFMNPDMEQIKKVPQTQSNRVELFTGPYAESNEKDHMIEVYSRAAREAQALGIGVNAGHDLNLANLEQFLRIPDILEVSIGHALIVECIEQGMQEVIKQYLELCQSGLRSGNGTQYQGEPK